MSGTGAGSITGVLDALDRVVDRCIERRSRAGYFAAMYRKVTAKVAEGITSGFFDDGRRMEHLDAVFATRYLDALKRHDRGQDPGRAWGSAFDAGNQAKPIIVQHLLVAISAHINLDLGIAAATTAPGGALPGLRRDFDRINEILAILIAGIEADLAEVSPWLGLLDRIGGRHDEELVRFSIEVARTQAWRFAVDLAQLPADSWAAPIAARDAQVAHLARKILSPGPLSAGLLVIRLRESNDVRKVIEVMKGVEEPDLATVEAGVNSHP